MLKVGALTLRELCGQVNGRKRGAPISPAGRTSLVQKPREPALHVRGMAMVDI